MSEKINYRNNQVKVFWCKQKEWEILVLEFSPFDFAWIRIFGENPKTPCINP